MDDPAMADHTWAVVTLVIKSAGFTPDLVEERLGVPSRTPLHKRHRY
ncbi:hypothetical protein [Haloechinothrix sp. LS1_15]|nr:hypothetical protein [Haloechinothrix sp. LS1_15]